MLRQQSTPRSEAPTDRDVPFDPTERPVELVRVRNYDHRQGHSVRVRVAAPGGETDCADRQYVQPGRTTSVSGRLAPGRYRLRVWVDGVERARTTCRLDDRPSGTAIVELGNGVVSVTCGAEASTSA